MTNLRTSDNITISIRHRGRHKGTAHAEAVIVAPGFFQSKETATFRNIESTLAATFDVISMDFRGHGKSKGLYTFSAREFHDLKAVIDYAREHHTRVGVLGFSYGGAIAIIEQHKYRNIDCLVCVGAPMASEEIEFEWWKKKSMASGLRGLEAGAGIRPGNPLLKKTRPIDVIARIGNIPVKFIHGSEDPTVNVRHGTMLYEKALQPKAMHIIEGGGHAQDLFRTHRDTFISQTNEWFEKHLRSAGTKES